ncbi:hypothetical protein M5689_009608 [Euphorbia peplus]|nr:hypothetical protein M5689_009608 [Euphorbia peplus]
MENNIIDYYPDPHVHDDDDDDESFFEIAVNQPVSKYDEDNYKYIEDNEEMELRVSFSSSFLHLDPGSKISSVSNYSCSSTTSSSPMFSFESPVRIEKMQFPACECVLVNTLRKIPSMSHVDHGNGGRLVSNNHLQFLPPSRPSIGMNNGMMMKVFVKFRDLKFIKTFITSLIKASHPNYKQKKAHQSLSKFNFPQEAKRNQQGVGEKSSRRILEINLDAIRGVFGRKTLIKGTTSCSTKSSPLHQNPQCSQTNKMCALDSSIQAAIAHCKR